MEREAHAVFHFFSVLAISYVFSYRPIKSTISGLAVVVTVPVHNDRLDDVVGGVCLPH